MRLRHVVRTLDRPRTRGVEILRFLGSALVVLGCVEGSGACRAQDSKDAPGDTETTEQRTPIPEIPKDQLPRQTRAKPNPEKDRYVREPVFVWVEEKIEPKGGQLANAESRVLESYLKGYLQRAGFQIAKSAEQATLLIEGTVELRFHSELKAFGRDMGWKYRGQASFLVRNREGKDLGSFDIPEVFRESVKSEASAALQLRRYMAKVVWDQLVHRETALSDPKVEALINALAVDGGAELLERQGYVDRVESTDEVIIALAEKGLSAVPYLLDALTDDRPVRMPSSYPGVADHGSNALRVYHIADKALEEIFQKVSRLSLDTDYDLRMVIQGGWENEWKRFCPSFAAFSKEQEETRRRAVEKRRQEAADATKE